MTYRPQVPPPQGPLSPANRPWTIALVLAVLVLVGFVALGGLDRSPSGDGGGAAPVGTTASAGGDGGETSSTEAGQVLTPSEGTEASGDTTSSTLIPTTQPSGPLQSLALETISDSLNIPVFVTAPPGDDRLFVLERPGVIKLVDGAGSISTFMDLTDRVDGLSGIEIGLLGLAFHPDFDDNGRFFVYYTDFDNEPRLSEFALSSDPNRGDPSSERLLIDIDKNGLRHNAGMLQFGPDGYLYVAIGDGGEFDVNGQNPDTLLGGILRIDVDNGDPYGVPPDNPFVAGGGAGEVWAYGLRNPWRFDIDSGLMYIGDVGQATFEEINIVPLQPVGHNFGWPAMEGPNCWSPPEGCDQTGMVLPATFHLHEDGQCSVTGGYVYRGTAIPELQGHYFYSDWCAGWVRTLEYVDGQVTNQQDWTAGLTTPGMVSSFGVDGFGEIYVVTTEGLLARIVPIR